MNRYANMIKAKMNQIKLNFKYNYWNFYWYHLHYLSLKYPEKPNNDQKKEIINLIDIMKTDEGLPCPICRDHFQTFISNKDIDSIVSDKKNLFTFFLDCHNEVNKKTNKEIIFYNEAFEYYSNDVVIKNKKYKWEELLSVTLDDNREVLIIYLFNNKNLSSFSKIFTYTFSEEFNRIKKLNNVNQVNQVKNINWRGVRWAIPPDYRDKIPFYYKDNKSSIVNQANKSVKEYPIQQNLIALEEKDWVWQ